MTIPHPTAIARTPKHYTWQWQGKARNIAYEVLGQGKPMLLLPAFSTVSTRREMAGIAQLLASQYQGVLIDWLGFGDSDRPLLDFG